MNENDCFMLVHARACVRVVGVAPFCFWCFCSKACKSVEVNRRYPGREGDGVTSEKVWHRFSTLIIIMIVQ